MFAGATGRACSAPNAASAGRRLRRFHARQAGSMAIEASNPGRGTTFWPVVDGDNLPWRQAESCRAYQGLVAPARRRAASRFIVLTVFIDEILQWLAGRSHLQVNPRKSACFAWRRHYLLSAKRRAGVILGKSLMPESRPKSSNRRLWPFLAYNALAVSVGVKIRDCRDRFPIRPLGYPNRCGDDRRIPFSLDAFSVK